MRDLERTDLTWSFIPKVADDYCKFVEKLPHIKGRWKTSNISLEDWQCFMLSSIFGWVDRDGLRRFRKAITVIPARNSKSTIGAAIALACMTLDAEPGAEIYSAATTRDQAKVVWDVARRMAQRSPGLCERFGIAVGAHALSIDHMATTFQPLSRDADSLEGRNIHCAIVDELHAHKTREVFDVIQERTGSRLQPLICVISTEGDSEAGVFVDQVNYLHDVLAGAVDDDRLWGIYYGLEPEDDWTLESSWRKANPNYGVSVLDMGARFQEAKHSPASQSSFLAKRLNVRSGAADAFFNMLAWANLCKDESLSIADFAGQKCIITLDLASKWDLSAKVTVFQRGKDYYVFSRCYLPEEALQAGAPNYDRYRGWLQSGHLVATPGNVTDYEFIERDLLLDMNRYKVKSVGYDPYQALQFSTRMTAEGVPMIEVPSTVKAFSDPMKELAALVISGRIHHDGDPVLTWAMGNVVARLDAKENVYPRKARNENKIDPAVALIANIGEHMREQVQKTSIYLRAPSM